MCGESGEKRDDCPLISVQITIFCDRKQNCGMTASEWFGEEFSHTQAGVPRQRSPRKRVVYTMVQNSLRSKH